MDDKISEFRIPLEAIRRFRCTPPFIICGEDEELFLCLFELVLFLRCLDSCLVDLSLHGSIDLGKLSVLADEVTELKCVAREALTYFHEASHSVEPPFQPNDNDSPESVDESQNDGRSNCDADSFNDVTPVNFSNHGKECTR